MRVPLHPLPLVASVAQPLTKPVPQSLSGVLSSAFLEEFPGAAAAYSLRDLVGNNPIVVRVRRSSDNTEQDFTASQITDGILASFCGTGDGLVTTWYDQSGNANDATQTTAASQPKIVDAGVLVTENGKAALDFDGTQFLATTKNLGISGTSPRAHFTYYNPSINSNLAYIYYGAGTAGAITQTSEIGIRTNGGNELYSVINTSDQLLSYIFPDSSSNVTDGKMFLDGTELSATSATPQTINTVDTSLQIGALAGTPKYVGTLNLILIYPSDQSANREAIESNINGYYGIY